jgi:hypothetical protein
VKGLDARIHVVRTPPILVVFHDENRRLGVTRSPPYSRRHDATYSRSVLLNESPDGPALGSRPGPASLPFTLDRSEGEGHVRLRSDWVFAFGRATVRLRRNRNEKGRDTVLQVLRIATTYPFGPHVAWWLLKGLMAVRPAAVGRPSR